MSPFWIGDSLRYKYEGHNDMVQLLDINTNYYDITKYSIKFFRGNTMIVTKDFLNSINGPDIGSTKFYSDDYKNKSKNLTQEQIENIMFPEVISPLQQ